MSYQFTAKMTCDGCGQSISALPENRATYLNDLLHTLKRKANWGKWVVLSRGRFRTEKHYCGSCSDGKKYEVT